MLSLFVGYISVHHVNGDRVQQAVSLVAYTSKEAVNQALFEITVTYPKPEWIKHDAVLMEVPSSQLDTVYRSRW